MYQEKIVDITTGEITLRDYSPDEVAAVEASIKLSKDESAAEKAKIEAKKVLLEKMGLTLDELAILLR